MAVKPRLLNPTTVTVTEVNSPKQRVDKLRRAPVNFIAKQASYNIPAQVKWNTQIGDFANPLMTPSGPDEREMGYIIVLVKDLKAKGKTLKRNDRLNVMGQFAGLNLYILRVEYGSHYGGEFTLVRAVFTDRMGKDGVTTPVVGAPAAAPSFVDEEGNTFVDEDGNPFDSEP